MGRLRQLILALVFLVLLVSPDFQGDTEQAIRDADGVLRCLAHGAFTGCREAGIYAPFQVWLAAILRIVRLPELASLSILGHFSTLCFALTLRSFYQTLRERSLTVAWLAVLIGGTGVLLHYGRSTFSEMSAAYFAVAYVSALIGGRAGEAASFAFLAALTKDTALPFLWLLGIASLWSRGRPRMLEARRLAIPSIFASLAGFALVIGFNFFRFGTPVNLGYLSPQTIVPSWRLQESFFAAIWFSPSGGIAPFWPSYFIFVFALSVLLVLKKPHSWFPWSLSVGVLSLLTLGFSRWCSPLGWWAWGPRLMMPWLPATLLVLAYSYAEEARAFAAAVFLGRRFWIALAVLLAVSLPHFLLIFNPGTWMECFAPAKDFVLGKVGPGPITVNAQPEVYYRLLQSALWKPVWVPAQLYMKPLKHWQLLLALAYCLAVADVCFRVRKGLSEGEGA